MTVSFRRIAAGDEAVFKRIAEDVFDEPVHPGRLKAYLADPNVLMVLAIEDGVVLGQCAGVIHHHPDKPDELYVDEVGVTPSAHRHGIARQMMAELFSWAHERGCHDAWVATEIDNGPARGLYTALGSTGIEMVYFEYLLAQDDPDGVDQAGEIAEQGEQDVQPEMQPQPDLQEHADRRNEDRQDDAQDVHSASSPKC